MHPKIFSKFKCKRAQVPLRYLEGRRPNTRLQREDAHVQATTQRQTNKPAAESFGRWTCVPPFPSSCVCIWVARFDSPTMNHILTHVTHNLRICVLKLKPNQASAFNLLSWKTRMCMYLLPRCTGTANDIGWSGGSCQRIQSTIDTAKRDSHLRQLGEADAHTRTLPISQSSKQQPCLLSVWLQIQRVPFFLVLNWTCVHPSTRFF